MRNNKTKIVVFCALSVALAFVTSLIVLFPMPYGGSVTLFSMLFITIAGYMFGPAAGIASGVALGVLVFLAQPVFLNFAQFLLDYIVAYGALGCSGFFRTKKSGLLKGYWVSILLRGAFASLAGYCFWSSYMPDNFPKAIAFLYPIAYNFLYILAEGGITTVFVSIPAVKKAIARIISVSMYPST